MPVRRILIPLSLCIVSASAPAQQGIHLDDMDTRVAACTDFYEYANGNWRAQHAIPDYMDRWSRRWESGEINKEHVRDILADVSARQDWPAGSAEQLAGDFYAACMDESRVNELGIAPALPLLREMQAIKGGEDIHNALTHLHRLGIPVPFAIYSTQDLHDPNMMIAQVDAGGLGLPDRDYYLKPDDRFVEARDAYRVHVAKMFILAGQSPADADQSAATVFEFEKRLAEASLDNVALRDPAQQDHMMSIEELTGLAPGFDWAAYFDSAGMPLNPVNVTQPAFVKQVNTELQLTPAEHWRTYLQWQVLNFTADLLANPFVEQNFDFYGRYLRGATEMKPRWKRCAEATDSQLGEALGRAYVDKYFPPAAKVRVQELVRNILLAMQDTINGLQWMSAATRQQALEKLSTFDPKIGYPEKWKDYRGVVVSRASWWDDFHAASSWNVADVRAEVGKPVDRARWGMTPPTSNAYYNPSLNEIVFPAGILQPPGFNMDATDAVNYGSIGVVIGHEISHGFDDQGAQFDAQGRLRNWWTFEDNEKFQERGQCVVDQFEGYFIEPGIHHNGKLVLGESIGDLAGAKLAYLGYQKSRVGKGPEPTIDGFTPEQQFFIAWGQFRGDAIRIETQRTMVQGDPHPIAKYRVNGPLSNLPAFRETFQCAAGDPMVREGADLCEVW